MSSLVILNLFFGGEGLLAYAFLIGWLNNATIVNVDAHDICVESILFIGAF